MKRLDNLDNVQESSAEHLDISSELTRSFQKLNAELDIKWLNGIIGQQDSREIDSKEEIVKEEAKVISKEVSKENTDIKEIKNLKIVDISEKTLRNKGKEVGKVRIYNKGLKRTLLAASFIVIGISAFIAGRNTNKKPIYQVSYNTLSTNYFDEPTYNGILYRVKSGDTLSTIIARYESDPNKQASLLNQIMNYNHLKTSNIINGDEIYLFGVPSSMLEEYGYSDNFNYFDPMVEINVRFDFLDKVAGEISGIEDAKGYVQSINDLKEWYQQFTYRYIPGEDDELNEILNEIRELSEYAKDYGFDFDFNKKAMPLSEAVDYQKESERTNN